MMDAQKTIQLTMQEIKELKLSLEEKSALLRQEQDQKGKEDKLKTIERIIDKLEH